MIGLIVGVLAGGLQFWLLSKFTKRISSGNIGFNTIALGLLQFFLPMGVLVAIAFAVRQDLLWAAIGIIASLIACAVGKYVRSARKSKGHEETNG